MLLLKRIWLYYLLGLTRINTLYLLLLFFWLSVKDTSTYVHTNRMACVHFSCSLRNWLNSGKYRSNGWEFVVDEPRRCESIIFNQCTLVRNCWKSSKCDLNAWYENIFSYHTPVGQQNVKRLNYTATLLTFSFFEWLIFDFE